MIIPSITRWGSLSMMLRFTKEPGSPSSALPIMYFGLRAEPRRNSHFLPVGNAPPPPAPRPPSRHSLLPAAGDVVVDVLGVRDAAVGHQPAHLDAEELCGVERRHAPHPFVADDGESEISRDPVRGDRLLDQR